MVTLYGDGEEEFMVDVEQAEEEEVELEIVGSPSTTALTAHPTRPHAAPNHSETNTPDVKMFEI